MRWRWSEVMAGLFRMFSGVCEVDAKKLGSMMYQLMRARLAL